MLSQCESLRSLRNGGEPACLAHCQPWPVVGGTGLISSLHLSADGLVVWLLRGTFFYKGPERYSKERPSSGSDLYSLGACMSLMTSCVKMPAEEGD
jgi:hypothetical protein